MHLARSTAPDHKMTFFSRIHFISMVVIGQFSSPEDASSQGLVYSSRLKTLHLFRTIFNDWEPWIQALAINQSANVCGVTAAISGALASSRLR